VAVVLAGCGSSGSALGDPGDGDSAATQDGGGASDARVEGDATTQDGGRASDARVESDASAAGDSEGGCPALQPGASSSCSPVGATCSYGGGICCGGTVQCSPDGTWQVEYATCACLGSEVDAGADGMTDAGLAEGGTCPGSCGTAADCNSCPQKNFGGWSCSGGVCRFMG
jgi:hypothetical protein